METGLVKITDYLLTQSWQIAILVVVIAAVNFTLRNKSAHVRYLLWLIVLAKCLVPPFYAVPLAILPSQEKAEPTPMFAPAEMLPPQHEAMDMRMTESSDSRSDPFEMTRPPTVEHRWQRLSTREGLGIGWLVGAGAFLMFNLLRALRASLWLWRRRKALPSALRNEIESLFVIHGVKNFPNVWLVEGFNQPFVWGLLRGSIYLPVDFLKISKPEHQTSVLGHELSHILRFDAAVNILQVIAQAIFWFHPLVWWTNRKIRAEREKCCDEMAVARLNTSPRDYSTAILETLAARHEPTRPVPSLAVAGPVKNIEERIKTMLRPGKKFYKHPTLVAATITLLTALLTVPTVFVLTARAGTGGVSTPLHQAVNAADIESVRSLLSDGADVNAKDDKGNTPLHLVAKYGYEKQGITELLIKGGAEVNARNKDGWTPLHFTAWRSYTGHRDIAELLIVNSADINARAKDGRIPLHYAARSGSLDIVELLLAKGTDVNARGWQDWTALHEAANWTARSVVELLLTKGADVNANSQTGWTPLHAAAGPGWPWHKQITRAQIVGLLVDNGSVVNAKDSDGCTPLHAAASWRRQGEVVEILLARGADINAKTDAGDTPTVAALQADHRDIFDLLTRNGGDVPPVDSLHSVARIGNLAKARSLIDKGADVNAKDWIGCTALHYAANKGNRDMIQLLISRGAKVNVQNKDGLTPLHKVSNRSCAEILIAQNTDVNAKDNEDFTPLHYAARHGHEDVVQLLISRGANVNPTNECRKPLHFAVMGGHTSIVKLLIEKGADVNAEDCYSDVPLVYARTREIGEILLDNGANPNARDMSSFTTLHYAAGTGYFPNGSVDIVDLLISKGADVNLINGWGGTALSIAERKGHMEIAKLLRKHGAKE